LILRFLEKASKAKVIDLQTRLKLTGFLERTETTQVDDEVTQARPVRPEATPPILPGRTPESTPKHVDASMEPPSDVSPLRPFETPPTPRPSETPSEPTPTPKTPTPSRAPATPRRLSGLANNVWDAVASDIALHGFAYLGVLLTFVGVLGFLLFAFTDVPDAAQPFVELFIVSVFFGWAWMLRRQKADRVADAMELVGGMVVPLILFAGLVDNAPIPPDFTGRAFVPAATLSSLALCGVYVWVSARNPRSTLRFLVAPVIWLSAMTVGFVFKTDEVLISDAITRLVSPQPALSSIAITLTLAAALFWRWHRLAAPTVRSSLVGVPVAYLLTVSLSVGEGWVRVWPVTVLGVGTLVSAELLAIWYEKQDWMGVARPFLLAGALAPLVPSLGAGWVGALSVGAYAILHEWEHDRRPGQTPAALLTVAGVAVGLVMSVREPTPMLLSFGLASIWAHRRRLDGQSSQMTDVFSLAAALLPIGVLVALGDLFGMGWAWLIMAGLVATLTVVVPRLGQEDSFWTFWLLGAAVVVGLGASDQWFNAGGDGTRSALALALVAIGLGTGQRWPVGRVWLASSAGTGALAVALATLGIASATQQVIWAGVGLIAVVAGALWRQQPADHLAAMGHVMGSATVVSLLWQGPEVPVLVAWAAGWIVSAAADERGGATVTSLLARAAARTDVEPLQRASRWLVPIMLVSSVPLALLEIAKTWPEFRDHRSWSGVLAASIGLVYAATTRVRKLRSPLRRSLSIGSVVASVIGVSVAAPDQWPTVLAALIIIAVAVLLSRDLRQTWFNWLAWLMTVVVALILAEQAGVPSESLHLVSLVWGIGMLLGGLVFDDRRSGRRERGEGLRTRWLRYPVLLGALVVPISLGPAFSTEPSTYGWWAIGASVVYGLVAHLIRVGSVTGPAYAFAALGFAALSPWSLTEDPWRFVFLAAPMVVLSWFAEARQSEANKGWLRWDLAPLIVAHGVGVVALVFAAARGGLATTAFAFGILSAAIGLWRRGRLWEEVGNLMIVLGAWDLGHGWLALALMLTSVRAAIGAHLASERSRASYHAISVLGAGLAWPTLLGWLDVQPAEAGSYSALLFGGLGLVIGGANRWLTLRQDTTYWWGGLAVSGMAGALVYSMRLGGPGIEGPWFSLGLLSLATGFEAAASGVVQRQLRFASVTTVGFAWLLMLLGLSWTLTEGINNTALAFGGLALVSSLLGGSELIGPENAFRWGVLGVAGVAVAGLVGIQFEKGTAIEGPALAIGLAMTGLAFEFASRFTVSVLRYGAVPTAALAWAALVVGMGWERATVATWTALVFGSLTLAVGEIVRLRGSASMLNVARSWALLGAAGVVVAVALFYDSADSGAAGYWAAGSLALLAVAAARGAHPLRIALAREGSALAALGSALTLAYTEGWPDVWVAGGTLVVAGAATFLSLAAWRRQADSVWLRPTIVLGAAANLIAAALSLGQLPDQTLLIGVLLSIGAQVMAVGLTASLPGVLAIGPPTIGLAFVLSVGESVGGSAQWYTVPAGLVILAEVEIFRKLPRFTDQGADRSLIVALEWVGFGILAAPPLVEMFTVSLFMGLIGIAVAAAVFVWGVVTKVRRRVAAAVALAIATTVLMLFAAAAGGAPESAFFWILAVGIGLAVMLVAGLVEAYRSKKGRAMARVDELMAGWE
jgi:hypothetical protein